MQTFSFYSWCDGMAAKCANNTDVNPRNFTELSEIRGQGIGNPFPIRPIYKLVVFLNARIKVYRNNNPYHIKKLNVYVPVICVDYEILRSDGNANKVIVKR